MNSQELQGLYESYLEVYDEAYKELPKSKMKSQGLGKVLNTRSGRNVDSKGNTINKRNREGVITDIQQSKKMRGVIATHNPEKSQAKAAENKQRGEKKKKAFGNRLMRSDGQGIRDSYEYDLYNIILSHLLDEGYAETQEAAEVIMVNMSEEWRESIVEEVIDEGYKELPRKKMARQATKKNLSAIKTSIKTRFTTSPQTTARNVDVAKANKKLSQAKKIMDVRDKTHTKLGSRSKEAQNRGIDVMDLYRKDRYN